MAGRENLRRGIAPPDSGHPEFNKHADDIHRRGDGEDRRQTQITKKQHITAEIAETAEKNRRTRETERHKSKTGRSMPCFAAALARRVLFAKRGGQARRRNAAGDAPTLAPIFMVWGEPKAHVRLR